MDCVVQMIPVPGTRTFIYVASALLLTAAVWSTAFWTVRNEHEKSLTDSAEQARQLALFFERHTLGIIRYGDAYLRMVRRGYVEQSDLKVIRRLMRDVPLDTSLVSHVTIIDETGNPVFNSRYAIKPGSTAKDRDYFRHQIDGGADDLYISLPHRGRNSGKLVVRLVRRITTPDGRFGGVIFAAVDAGSITEFFAVMNLGPKSSATLVGSDRKIRARSSYGRLGPGQDISGSRIWRELEIRPVGLYKQLSVVDGITRYYAYRKLIEFPLIVEIGVSVEDISLAVTEFQYPIYSIAILVTILIVAMTFLLSREIAISEKLTASESRVRRMRDELEERFQDRTAELESVQQELLLKERLAALGQLTGTVAHELRNPLNTITASTAVIERRLRNSNIDLEAVADRVRRNVDRCNNIITELLDFARATGVDSQPTELDQWLADVLLEIAPREGVTVDAALDAQGAVVAFDRDRMRRAVVNLVDNAHDAILSDARHGVIRVSTRIENGRVEIAVTDDGPGIADDLMNRVHEPLFSTKTFGVGLGIPIIRRIMEEHHGGLEITSKADQGTRALLWLPMVMSGDTKNAEQCVHAAS